MTALNRFISRLSLISLNCLFSLLICVPVHALDFSKQQLPNGLTVLHVQRSNLPMVMVTVLIKASPLNEEPEKAGLASLTAKLLTEGTKKRKVLQISEEIEFLGASLGTSAGNDFTMATLSVLKKDVEKGFDILADILLHPAFSNEELARKKDLIKGFLRQRDEDPSYVAQRAFLKGVYGDYPYGRPVEGAVEGIDRVTRDDVLKFYKTYYRPENCILSVVGDLSPKQLSELIKKHFSQWQRGAHDARVKEAHPAVKGASGLSAPKLLTINKDISQANIVLGHPGIARDNPDYYAVTVMNYMLGGGGFASRLVKTVRDDMGLAYSIYSVFIAHKESGHFEVEVQTKNESAHIVVREIIAQMQKIRSEEVTDQELEDAKAYLTGSFPRRLETSRKIADFLTVTQFYGLEDDYLEQYPEYIKKVTKKDVLRVAQKHLCPDAYVLSVVGNLKQVKSAEFEALKDTR